MAYTRGVFTTIFSGITVAHLSLISPSYSSIALEFLESGVLSPQGIYDLLVLR